MGMKHIMIDCRSSLAYDESIHASDEVRPAIKVTTKAEILKKKQQLRGERIFSLSAAGAIVACDGVIFALILKIGRLIGLQTGSFTAAGCYLSAMSFLTLIFLESAGRQKHSGLIDGMAHIWRVITLVCAVTLVACSALRSPDSGGSIIVVSLIGVVLRRYLKN